MAEGSIRAGCVREAQGGLKPVEGPARGVMRCARLAALPVLLVAVAHPALAQMPPPQVRQEAAPGAVVDDANRVFGDDAPVFAPLGVVGALGLSVSAAMSAEYNNNVARIADGEALPGRFDSKDDFILRPTVTLDAERALGRQRLFASASLGRAIYTQNNSLSSNRYFLGGGIDLSLGRSCGGAVQGGWSRRDTQLGAFEDVVASQQARTTFGASLSCATVTGISGSVGYSRGRTRNYSDDPSVDRSFADSNSQSVTGSLGYRLGVRGQVGVSGSWAESAFPNQLVLGEENRNEITSYSLFGSYRIGTTLNASAGFGRTKVTSDVPGGTDFSGGTWNIGLSYSGPRLGASLSAGRGVSGGGSQSSNFAVNQTFSLSSTYRLGTAASLSAGYAYVDSDYRGNIAVPETEAIQSATTHRLFAGLDYRLNRMFRLAFDVNYQKRNARPDQFGFDATSVSVGLFANF